MIGIIVTLIVGGIIGWLASVVMRTDAQQGIILNVVVGIIGAFLGNILGGLFGMGATLSSFSPIGLLWSFIGAILLLGLLNLVSRGRVR
ncbi:MULTISPECIES: GlsB/YeaQ/YmgE family stress response membrane protein [unclassified Sphingopyxis]|uniref:GlsB/YeaQ/YmgE family stress response membrane protein n=1 Tax=unclassified Sphingopyxis TaxID=2614943 RepID=UPI000AF45BDA|nr:MULTISPECIES: GlsB/YeaQ/YmgE family stress response membrane protein [unclassified Sphingopyxis]